MKEMIWSPESREIKKEDGSSITEEAKFLGEVKLKVLSYPERLRAMKQLQLKANAKGEVVFSSEDSIDAAIKLYEILEPNITSMKLVHIETENEYGSLEELGYSDEGSQLISEMGNVLLGGIRLGKKLGSKSNSK